VTVHALLHIADSIETVGPVWTTWAFPMERFCGKLQRAVKGRRFVYAAIDNWVLRTAQVAHIRIVYNLSQADLTFAPPPISSAFRLAALEICECEAYHCFMCKRNSFPRRQQVLTARQIASSRWRCAGCSRARPIRQARGGHPNAVRHAAQPSRRQERTTFNRDRRMGRCSRQRRR
jgi:hypothetical protein